MTDRDPAKDRSLDPGAFIGREPELEAETIPRGVGPTDERVAAYDSRAGVPGQPDDDRGPYEPCPR